MVKAMLDYFLFSEDLLEKALSVRAATVVTLLFKGRLKTLENLLLLCVEVAGGLYVYCNYEVAEALGIVDIGNTLASDGEGFAGLCALGNSELFLTAVKHRNLDLCAERRLCKADGDLAVEVVALSGEERVVLYSYLDDEVAVRTAVSARRALTAKHYILICVDAGGDIDLELFVDLNVALAVTVVAGGLDDLTCTATGGAGSLCL